MNAMTNEEFKAWRKFMGLSQERAGRVLGISAETVKSYERGTWSDAQKPAVPSQTVSNFCWFLRQSKEAGEMIQLLAKGK